MYPLYMRLGGLQVGVDGCGKSRPPPGFDPRTVQPVASRYTDWAIPTHIDSWYGAKNFRFSQTSEDYPPLLSNTNKRTPLSEVRRSKREAQCSPPFNEEVKDEVSYACIPPYVFRDKSRPTKTLTVMNKSTDDRSVGRISLTRQQYSVSPQKLLWFVHSFCSRISRKSVRDSTQPLT
jgi:hypothetical protein